MSKLKSLAILASLSACGPLPPGSNTGVTVLGNGLYQTSEMGFIGGSVATKAAQYCREMHPGSNLAIVGNTTQTGMYSGTSYPVLIFRCDEKENEVKTKTKKKKSS